MCLIIIRLSYPLSLSIHHYPCLYFHLIHLYIFVPPSLDLSPSIHPSVSLHSRLSFPSLPFIRFISPFLLSYSFLFSQPLFRASCYLLSLPSFLHPSLLHSFPCNTTSPGSPSLASHHEHPQTSSHLLHLPQLHPPYITLHDHTPNTPFTLTSQPDLPCNSQSTKVTLPYRTLPWFMYAPTCSSRLCTKHLFPY